MSKKKPLSQDSILKIIKDFYRDGDNEHLIFDLEYIRNHHEDFSKKVLQFLFYYNFTILDAQTTNSLRHYFPIELVRSRKSNEFFIMLKDTFKSIEIDIKTVKLEDSKSVSYFYFKNYSSLFKFLIYWDNSWVKFPDPYLNFLKEFFDEFEIYIHLNNEFMGAIFGEKGIIKKNNITITKFFNSIADYTYDKRSEKYHRHAIYKWRNENYFPANIFYDLIKSEYAIELDSDFYEYIEAIKIGKSKKVDLIKKDLLDEIRTQNKEIFQSLIPYGDSILGFIIYHSEKMKRSKFNILNIFEDFLKSYPAETIEANKTCINQLRQNLSPEDVPIYVRSVELINFGPYVYEKIDFHNRVNIIYGLNESGKTSIFKAILFALFPLKLLYPIIRGIGTMGGRVRTINLDRKFIKIGKDYCQVNLKLKKGNRSLIISRKLWKNGEHELKIDNKNILENINPEKLEVIRKLQKKSQDIRISENVILRKELERTGFPNRTYYHLYINNRKLDDFDFTDLDWMREKYKLQDKYKDYFNRVHEEINNQYAQFNCLFSINDIFMQLSDFGNSGQIFRTPEKFFTTRFGLDFIGEDIQKFQEQKNSIKDKNLKENIIKKIDFLIDIKKKLYKSFLNYINENLTSLTKEVFNREKFSHLNEYGSPIIKFQGYDERFPISILSGGERSKLILILLSILMRIPRKNAFILIDEPNELLDSHNMGLMKQFFFSLFEDKQILVGTFIEDYKSFQPALIHEVWKDHHGVAHVFKLKDKEKLELFKKMDEIEIKIEQNPKDYHTNQRKLVLLMKLNRYKEALDFFQNIKGLGLDLFDDIESLESFLTKIINLHKDKETSKEKKANYYRLRALIFYQLKELHQAIENIDEALKLGSNMPEIYDMKSHCLLYINKPNKALETLEEGIKLFPDHTGFYNTKGDILEMLGRYEEALVEINKAIEIDKERPWNYYKKAFILGQKMERFEEALVNINKALEFHPDDGIYNADKINYLINNQEYGEAYETLEKYKENIPEPNQVLGWIYEEQAFDYANSGKKDEAIDLIKKALALFPDWSEYYHAYGKILMDFGDYEKALTKFEKAKELHFTPIETYIKMGKCLYELGKYEEALKHFETGRHLAQHSIKQVTSTEDDKRIAVDFPQTELIEEADNYILKVQDKINLLK